MSVPIEEAHGHQVVVVESNVASLLDLRPEETPPKGGSRMVGY
jgi:hypothetical protein